MNSVTKYKIVKPLNCRATGSIGDNYSAQSVSTVYEMKSISGLSSTSIGDNFAFFIF